MKEKMKTAHMTAAHVYANLSTARRLKVGCLVVEGDRVTSIGYNGTAPGEDNNCEIEPENWDGDIGKLKSKPDAIHAEDNALRKLTYYDFYGNTHSEAEGCDLFITHAPCLSCAQKIVDNSIKRVYFGQHYRDTEGIDYLKEHGVEVELHNIFDQNK